MKAILTAVVASFPVTLVCIALMIHTDAVFRPFVPYIVAGLAGLVFMLGWLNRK